MFDVVDINLDPNQKWFIRLSDSGFQMLVELFNTLADAQAVTNRVASATVNFGNSVLVTFTADSTPTLSGDPIAKFNSALAYQMKVNGTDGDTTLRYSVGPFTDLPSVEDSLMLTEQIIQARATVEINRHTHTVIRRIMQMKDHTPNLNEGDIVFYSSTRRSIVNLRQQIADLTLQIRQNADGSVDFFDEIETIEWKDFTRV